MICQKCNQSAAPLIKVVVALGHAYPSGGPYHFHSAGAGEAIDFEEKWCFPCFKSQMEVDP